MGQKNSNVIISVDDIMTNMYGAVGSQDRESFRKEAYAYCMGQIILDVRKQENITQEELATRIGASKSYISRIEIVKSLV